MKHSITKFEQLPPELKKKQEDNDVSFSVGDMFFYKGEGRIIRIREINKEGRIWDDDKKKTVKIWQVLYDGADDWEATKWRSYGSDEYDDFIEHVKDGDYVKIDRPLKEVVAEANKVISGEISIDVYSNHEFEETNEETALIGRNSKQSLTAIQNSLQQKKRAADLIHKAVAYEMERRKQELNKIKDRLYGVVAKFEKQIKKIRRVITTIELYLGIDEEIVQIQEGEKAPADTPISFRQLVLFMDEEVGIHEDGGIDFKSIEKFDEWLLIGNNLDIVLPEKKGMVVLRPRRKDKHYSSNGWLNCIMNIPNHTNTYILIRNGDNVYRIFTEKLTIADRLFPKRKELQALYDRMQKESWDRKKEEIEDEMYQYKKRAILMQGLIDRTEIFYPLPVEKLSIFKLHEHEDVVKFIYDDDMSLDDGRPRFNDWWKGINEKIEPGSRVLVIDSQYGYKRSDWADRFYLSRNSYDGLKNVPDLPKEGVYEVEEFSTTNSNHYRETEFHKRVKEYTEKKVRFTHEIVKGKVWTMPDSKTGSKVVYSIKVFSDEKELTIMYKPKEQARSGWSDWRGHDRKNRTRFKIEKDDDFILNYDQIDLDDVEYYLHNRVDRENYLSMMPILKNIKKHILEEMKNEEFFIKFVAGRNSKNFSEKEMEARVKESVRWWKYKNKWKRPITKDDTLALRMIEKRILSDNYDNLKKL